MIKKSREIPKFQREAEGKLLKSAWLEFKSKNPDATQKQLCEAVDLNQGFLQQMFSGASPIPLEVLIDISLEIAVDPRTIRPSLDRFVAKVFKAIGKVTPKQISEQISLLESIKS